MRIQPQNNAVTPLLITSLRRTQQPQQSGIMHEGTISGLKQPSTSFSCACCAPLAVGLSSIGLGGIISSFVVGATCVVVSFWDSLKNHAQSLLQPFIK